MAKKKINIDEDDYLELMKELADIGGDIIIVNKTNDEYLAKILAKRLRTAVNKLTLIRSEVRSIYTK